MVTSFGPTSFGPLMATCVGIEEEGEVVQVNPPTDANLQPLIGWLDQEVRARLSLIDAKLDEVLQQQHQQHLGVASAVARQHAVSATPLMSPRDLALCHIAARSDSREVASRACLSVPKGDDGNIRREAEDGSSCSGGDEIRSNGSFHSGRSSEESEGCTPYPGREGADDSAQASMRSLATGSRSEMGMKVTQRRLSFSAVGNEASGALQGVMQKIVETRRGRSVFADGVWNALEDSDSSAWGRAYEKMTFIFIGVTVITALLQTWEEPPINGIPAAVMEASFDVLFLLEVTVRFAVCPNRRMFLFSPYNFIDLLSCLPLVLRGSMGWILPESEDCDMACKVLLGAVPVLRIIKVLRRFQKFHLLLKAFELAAEALPVMVYMYVVIMLLFTASLFIIDGTPTFRDATWLAIVSMTTLGYGDSVPSQESGRVVVGLFVFVNCLYMAIPVGIIGNAFNDVWKDRDRILLMTRTRARMEQAGYSAKDVPKLFKLFDSDRNGQLDIDEFFWMLQGMHLGLRKERMIELYECFDDDKSGGIDHREFMKALFPEAYAEIYGASGENDVSPGDSQSLEGQRDRSNSGGDINAALSQASARGSLSSGGIITEEEEKEEAEMAASLNIRPRASITLSGPVL